MSELFVSDEMSKLRDAGWVHPVLCIDCIHYQRGLFCDFLTDDPDAKVFMDTDDYCSYGVSKWE